MLTVIEHKQHVTVANLGSNRCLNRDIGPSYDIEDCRGRVGDEVRVRYRGEFDEPNTARIRVGGC